MFVILLLAEQGASAADLRVDTRHDPRTTHTDTTSTKTTTSIFSGHAAGSTSTIRSHDDVRRSQSAHAHTMVDHSINRMNAMGLGRPTTGATRIPMMATSTEVGGGSQNLVMTSGQSSSGSASSSSGPQQGGNQGVGDGSGVSVTATTSLSQLNSEVAHVMTLHDGTAFVAHHEPVCVKTSHGDVTIAPHSAVYIISKGHSVAVFNIADRHANDVMVKLKSNKTLSVKTGEQLLLTAKENHDYNKANPAPEIKTSRTKELGNDRETKIYNSEFSPLAVLDHAHGFHQLLNSTSKKDQALANHVLKTAAIVMTLRAGD